MALRTFYWDPTEEPPTNRSIWGFLRRPQQSFKYGNAGDSFNLDLLQWAYPDQQIHNIKDSGSRLMLVGSVAHRALDGDMICGIGSKHDRVPTAEGISLRIVGVRGPKTLEAFNKAGHDVSGLRFMGDPGFLIGKIYPEVLSITAELGRVIFIPHYRERFRFQSTRSYQLVSIDALPSTVAAEIRRAEFVYTSSLHGLIWAHALERPACLVAPMTDESIYKYEDYFLSIKQPFRMASTIDDALRQPKSTSPIDVSSRVSQVQLPTFSELVAASIAH